MSASPCYRQLRAPKGYNLASEEPQWPILIWMSSRRRICISAKGKLVGQIKPFTDAAESVSDPLKIYRVLAEADKTPRWIPLRQLDRSGRRSTIQSKIRGCKIFTMKSYIRFKTVFSVLFFLSGLPMMAQTVPSSYSWTSTGPIISAQSDATHSIIAVKDPSTVYYNGQYLVYASDVNSSGDYNLEYLHFSNWSEASSAAPYFLDTNPNLAGYHASPQVFYFAPKGLWYLVFQSGQPQYATNSDPTQPQNWSAPTNFFATQPPGLDFRVICDSTNCYLFFCGDNGNFYSSSTPIGNFPNGFSDPVIVYSESNAFNLFEADRVYSVEGTGTYLAVIECLGGPLGSRFFRALTATSLAGPWTPLGNTENFATPFLGEVNVTFQTGAAAWTNDFSSGGAVIDGNDQTVPINIHNLQFLYQGDEPNNNASSYNLIPWQLGLATSNANTLNPDVALSPKSLTFADETLGTQSAAQTVTLSNTGNAALGLTSITASGDFAVTQNCGTSVAVGANCTLSVTFTPTAGGTRTGTITIADSASSSPQIVSLTGGGEAFTIAFSSAGLALSSPGQTATATIQLTSVDGFSGTVSLGCSVTYQGQRTATDLPTCSLSPSQVAITASATGSSTLHVSTTAADASVGHDGMRKGEQLAYAACCCILLLAKRRRQLGRLLALFLVAATAGLVGCGGSTASGPSNPGTASGNYIIQVTATSGSTSVTASIPLTVGL